MTVNNSTLHNTPMKNAGSHPFYRYSPIIPKPSTFSSELTDKHSSKLAEAGLSRNSSIHSESNGEFSTAPIDGVTKDSCSPPERNKFRQGDEASQSKSQSSETVPTKPKIWSISNIMNSSSSKSSSLLSSSSSSSSSSSCNSSSSSSSMNNSCHLNSKGTPNKISARAQLPPDSHLSANRPSILHYDSAMSRERMYSLQIYLPPHELLTNAFNHSSHADLTSFRNLCVGSNHPLETPPHTPPERQGGSQFDTNCPQHSAPLLEAPTPLSTAAATAATVTTISLPPSTGQSRDINGISLVKSFHKIPK